MDLNIESQKQEFLTICRAAIHREGADEAATFLLER